MFAAIGIIISKLFNPNMGGDTWFWFFSSVAQTFAAIVALLAIFSISRFEYYRSQIIIHHKELEDMVRKHNIFLHTKDQKYIRRDEFIKRVDNFLSSTSISPDMEYIKNEIEYIRNLIKNFKDKENRMKIWMRSSLKNTCNYSPLGSSNILNFTF